MKLNYKSFRYLMIPIKTEYVKLRKSDLIKNRLLVAIDGGRSLTKILFLNKNKQEEFLNEEATSLTLEFHLFPNDEIESALELIKSNTLQLENDDYGVHVTGVFAIKNRNKIKRILNKDLVFIDKRTAISTGCNIALEHIGIENMLAPNVQVEGYGQFDSEMINKFLESIEAKFKTNALTGVSSYPCVFNLSGSCSLSLCSYGNGATEYYGLENQNGKTFLGLAKCLLDTNVYSEIIDLASFGNRNNVDTLAKEMLDETIDSPYGKFPPYFPIFSFGKCGDHNKGLSDVDKRDVAKSLVSFYAMSVAFESGEICKIKNIPKAYFSGNLFNSDLFQIEIKKLMSAFPIPIELVFLNFTYYGVLGAMFCDENSLIMS